MSEGPAVEQLAQDNPGLHIVGLGAQDSLDQANDFITRTGTGTGALTMVWDPSFDSWREFGIRSQPYWILYDAQGNEITSQPGAIDIGQVQAVLAS